MNFKNEAINFQRLEISTNFEVFRATFFFIFAFNIWQNSIFFWAGGSHGPCPPGLIRKKQHMKNFSTKKKKKKNALYNTPARLRSLEVYLFSCK